MANGNARCARPVGEAIAVQRQVDVLPALGLQACPDVEAAGERQAGEARPARQIGHLRTESATGQPAIEIDAKLAVNRTIRRLDLQIPDRQLGAVVKIGVERQGAVEAAAAKSAGNGDLRVGKIGDRRIEPHTVEQRRARGDIRTVDLHPHLGVIDRSLGADMGGQTACQIRIQRDAQRLQLADIGVEGGGKLPGCRIEMPVRLETRRRAGQAQALDLQNTRRVALPRPGDRDRLAAESVDSRDPGPKSGNRPVELHDNAVRFLLLCCRVEHDGAFERAADHAGEGAQIIDRQPDAAVEHVPRFVEDAHTGEIEPGSDGRKLGQLDGAAVGLSCCGERPAEIPADRSGHNIGLRQGDAPRLTAPGDVEARRRVAEIAG